MTCPARSRFLLCSLLASAAACGYVGYETDRDDAASPDAGMDASMEGDAADGMDAEPSAEGGEEPPDAMADDGSVAEPDMDANDGDADTTDAGDLDASPVDAASDAAMDAGELDASADADAAPLDAGEDARQATQVSDYCLQIPALPGEPVIDGVIDGALALVPLTPVDWSNTAVPLPTHTTAEYALAFRPNGLYAFVRVHDPNRLPPIAGDFIWRGDGVELYADDDAVSAMQHVYDSPGAIQIIVAAPDNDTTPSTRATRFRDAVDAGAWSSSRFAAFPTADGYVLEAFMEASALDLASWSLTSGGRVGMDLGVNVSPAGELDAGTDASVPVDGLRLGQYFLHTGVGDSCNGRPFCTPAAFCTPTLVD